MNFHDLMRSSKAIARRNVTDNVIAITVDWDEKYSKLTVTYYVDGDVTDDDEEWCDLTYSELTAEFPAIRSGDANCFGVNAELEKIKSSYGLVYLKGRDG